MIRIMLCRPSSFTKSIDLHAVAIHLAIATVHLLKLEASNVFCTVERGLSTGLTLLVIDVFLACMRQRRLDVLWW